jgi:hypothetical protein
MGHINRGARDREWGRPSNIHHLLMDKIRRIRYRYSPMNSACAQSTWFQCIPGTLYSGVTLSSLELMEAAQSWGKGDRSLIAVFGLPNSYELPTSEWAPALGQLAGAAGLSANTWLPAWDHSLGELRDNARFQDDYSAAWSSTPGPVRPALFDATIYLGWSPTCLWSDAWHFGVGSAELTAYDRWLRRRGRTYKQILKTWYRDGRRQPPRWAAACAVGRKRTRALPLRCARRSCFHRPCPRNLLKKNGNSADVDAPQISMSMRWLNGEINSECVTN